MIRKFILCVAMALAGCAAQQIANPQGFTIGHTVKPPMGCEAMRQEAAKTNTKADC